MKPKKKSRNDAVEILVVEDSRTQAEHVKHLLEEQGYAVRLAADGQQALRAVRERKPTIILSDILMPGMDGFALCKEIKSQEDLKDVPVILLTSLTSPQDIMQGLECGADNFIGKPCDDKYLLSRIEFILLNQKLRRSERTQFGVEIYFVGKKYFITSERQQILDLLISTYENAVRLNEGLRAKETELARSYQLLSGIYRIAEALNQCTSVQQVVDRALEGAVELPGVEAAWITLREGEAGFRLAGARNLPPALQSLGALEGDCLCCRKLLAGELDRATNILECERLQKAEGDTRGLHYHASVPLWFGNRVVGVMNLARPSEGVFREEDLEPLYSVGNQVAVGMERAQLLEQLEEKVKERTAALTAEIAERKRAEEALRVSNERFRQMAENIKEVFLLADAAGRTIYINEAYEEFYGRTRESLYNSPMSWLEAVHADDRDRVTAAVEKAVREGTEIAQDFRIVRPDGSARWILQRISPVRDAQGRVSRFVGTAQDVTESKKLEEQLRQAAKMEAIGQLAGGVAHDFNNLLTIITGYSQLLLDRLGPDDKLREYVGEITGAGNRAAGLTRQLLAFGRRQVLQPQLLDLNLVVATMDRMLRRLIGEDINLVTVRGPALGRVKADPGQVEQIIMNLAVNARDAMPRGGKLTIETANVELDDAYARNHVAVTPGRYAMLAVSDTGQGMDEETRAHIFEPFFTTKEKGKGTGLGLATVYGIVKQSGGNIWVYSEPGKGATFKIYLPLAGEEVESVVPAEAHATPAAGSETILLVEDEAAVRTLARAVLESNGYTVLEAHSAPEALLICERYKQAIHLLLTDVVMPQLGGPEVAERLKPSHPESKVLYMSGYTDNAIVHHGVLEAGTAFLQKPFTPSGLLGKVREVLGA